MSSETDLDTINSDVSRPNVLLIIVDSLRARNVGAYGHAANTTPFLDDLAAKSLRFESAWSPAVWTLPSHTSLLSGYEVDEHEVTSHADRIRPSELVFHELHEEYGYATGLFSENTWLTEADMGIKSAFETVVGKPSVLYPDGLRPGQFAHENDYGQYLKYLGAALRSDTPLKSILNGVSSKIHYDAPRYVSRRFTPESSGEYYVESFEKWHANQMGAWAACINLMDAHRPYEPDSAYDNWDDGTARRIQSQLDDPVWPFIQDDKPRWMLKALEALYDGGIRQADVCIRQIVEHLKSTGDFEDTLLIVTSDHGEGFGEPSAVRGGPAVEHKQGVHHVQAHVPLVVNPPVDDTGVVPTPVSLTETARVIAEVVNCGESSFDRKRPVVTVCNDVNNQLIGDEPRRRASGRIESVIRSYGGTAVKQTRIGGTAESAVSEVLPNAQCSYESDEFPVDFGGAFADLRSRKAVRDDASIGERATERLEQLGYK